jgi:hypothetical protein
LASVFAGEHDLFPGCFCCPAIYPEGLIRWGILYNSQAALSIFPGLTGLLRNAHEIKSPMKYLRHCVGADLSALGE